MGGSGGSGILVVRYFTGATVLVSAIRMGL